MCYVPSFAEYLQKEPGKSRVIFRSFEYLISFESSYSCMYMNLRIADHLNPSLISLQWLDKSESYDNMALNPHLLFELPKFLHWSNKDKSFYIIIQALFHL